MKQKLLIILLFAVGIVFTGCSRFPQKTTETPLPSPEATDIIDGQDVDENVGGEDGSESGTGSVTGTGNDEVFDPEQFNDPEIEELLKLLEELVGE